MLCITCVVLDELVSLQQVTGRLSDVAGAFTAVWKPQWETGDDTIMCHSLSVCFQAEASPLLLEVQHHFLWLRVQERTPRTKQATVVTLISGFWLFWQMISKDWFAWVYVIVIRFCAPVMQSFPQDFWDYGGWSSAPRGGFRGLLQCCTF